MESFTAQFGEAEVTVCDNGTAYVNGTSLWLTINEHIFLLLLARCKGKVCTNRMLLHGLYGKGEAANRRILDVIACKVRKKLRLAHKDHKDAEFVLSSVWGRGHAFGAPTSSATTTEAPADFPKPDGKWITRRKAFILEALREGRVTEQQLYDYYPNLSPEELEEWIQIQNRFGTTGLRTTRAQIFELPHVACAP